MERVRGYLGHDPRRLVLPIATFGLLVLPIVSPNDVSIATQALLFGLFAISVDIALGYTGLLTLAPAAFFGIGGYSLAKIVVDYGGSFWLGFPVAIVVAAVTALLIGYTPIKQRISMVYFALFTLAFGVIAYDFVYVTTSFTGGSNGLAFISPPTVFGVDLSDLVAYYYFTLLVVAVVAGGLYLLLRSDYGDVLHATRQNELRMRYLGYNTDREKLIVWILSAVVSSIAGAVYVASIGIASPSIMSFALTGEVLIWVVVGGAGTFAGPFFAAFALTFLENSLGSLWAEGYLLVLGILFVAFVFLFPEGIVGRFWDESK
ncbi:branched-chain amino acid ABC transporter permease [Halosolutus gelatinilyticus]|uniref:branched-chain amino acid ABC transporter permease n=1 Tax=Halosolutus gelatinilyticus TaxID=2931975 RepID=UPI001FF5964A|nr:branched-chain amino acid ABC transporter permease [Halosolutus gelatinilyticus]